MVGPNSEYPSVYGNIKNMLGKFTCILNYNIIYCCLFGWSEIFYEVIPETSSNSVRILVLMELEGHPKPKNKKSEQWKCIWWISGSCHMVAQFFMKTFEHIIRRLEKETTFNIETSDTFSIHWHTYIHNIICGYIHAIE